MRLLSNNLSQSGLLAFIVSFLFSCPQLFAQQQQEEEQITKRTVVVIKDGDTMRHMQPVNVNRKKNVEVIIINGNQLQDEDIELIIDGNGESTQRLNVVTKEVNVKVDETGTTTRTITTVVEKPDGTRDTIVQETELTGGADDADRHMIWISDENIEEEIELDEEDIMIIENQEQHNNAQNVSIRIMVIDLNDDDIEIIQPKVEANTNTLTLNELRFFPNPSDGQFDLNFNGAKAKKLKLTIFNMAGQTVYEETVKNFNGNYYGKIDISSKEKGTYILLIDNGTETFSKKVIIQ